MRRSLLLIVLVALAAGAGGWWWLTRATTPVGWQGYVDADYIRVGPTLTGQLVSLAVHRGDEVAADAPLFAQDDIDERAAVKQAAAQLAEAEARATNMEKSGREAEIAQAEADLADMRAARDKIGKDLARNEQLLPHGAVSAQTVDQQRADLASASAHVQAAEAKLELIRSSTGRQYEIAAQHAVVEAQQAALAQANWRLAQRHLCAPVAGRVVETYALPGEMVQAGAPVVELLPPENILVRFFVPETTLPGLHRGQAVAIGCDSCAAGIVGHITFIAPESEYTPPVIYSESTRGSLVYLIEAHPDPKQATMLKPGQPVTVQVVP